MFYIPAGLKKFHTLCTDNNARFATGGVQVEHTVSDTEGVPGKITVASTDTKHLVSAEFADDIIPEHAAAKLKGSPNGVHTGLIAASDWKKMFAGSRLHGVAGQFGTSGPGGTGMVTLAAVDQSPGRNASIPGAVTMSEFQSVEGRFPPYQQFFPKERDLVAGIMVDPQLMGSVCDVLKSAGVTRMLMRFTKDTLKPIIIEGVSRDGCIVKYKAILMPMGYESEDKSDIETPYGKAFINPDLVGRKQETSEDTDDKEESDAIERILTEKENEHASLMKQAKQWADERGEMKRQIANLESQLSFERSKQQAVTTDNPTPTVRKRVALG